MILTSLLALAFLPGCGPSAAGGGSSKAVASTKVEFESTYTIGQAILTVFQIEGFQPSGRTPDRLRFLKVGDAETQEAFGDWFAPGVVVEAEVIIIDVEFGTHRVECRATARRGGVGVPVKEHGRFKILMKRVKKLAGVL